VLFYTCFFAIGHDIGNGYSFYLCRNSFLNVLIIVKKRYKTLKETRFIPGANLHKNTGNQHADLSSEVTSSVVNFIHQKDVEEGEVYATRIIRSLTGHELRDEEKGGGRSPFKHIASRDVREALLLLQLGS
jgi:hypothetical protein